MQKENNRQGLHQRYLSDEHLPSIASTRQDIPTSAVPAFLDELPDLSRYPKLQHLHTPRELSTPAHTDVDLDLPFQSCVPSSTSIAAQNPCPQPSSGSILELKKYRETPPQEIQHNCSSSDGPNSDVTPSFLNTAPTSSRPRANSDLRDIYTNQQQGPRILRRSNSKLVSVLRRHNSSSKPALSPSPVPSSESDRASLPSQKSKTSADSMFDEGRKLSRSGALRRKKTGDSSVALDSQLECVPSNKSAHDIPAPPPDMIHRLQDANRPSPVIRENSLRRPGHKRNCITIDVG